MTRNETIALGLFLAVVSGAANAAGETTIDFSSMVAAVSAASVIAAFTAMGVVKLGPNFAKWAINKVAGFFGR